MLREWHEKTPAHSARCSPLLSVEAHRNRSFPSSTSLPSVSSSYHPEALDTTKPLRRAGSAEISPSLCTSSSVVGDFTPRPLNEANTSVASTTAHGREGATAMRAALKLSADMYVPLHSPLQPEGQAVWAGGPPLPAHPAARPRFSQTPPPPRPLFPIAAFTPLDVLTSQGGRKSPSRPLTPHHPLVVPTADLSTAGLECSAISEADDDAGRTPHHRSGGETQSWPLPNSLAPVLKLTGEEDGGDLRAPNTPSAISTLTAFTTTEAMLSPVSTTGSAPTSFYRPCVPSSRSSSGEIRSDGPARFAAVRAQRPVSPTTQPTRPFTHLSVGRALRTERSRAGEATGQPEHLHSPAASMLASGSNTSSSCFGLDAHLFSSQPTVAAATSPLSHERRRPSLSFTSVPEANSSAPDHGQTGKTRLREKAEGREAARESGSEDAKVNGTMCSMTSPMIAVAPPPRLASLAMLPGSGAGRARHLRIPSSESPQTLGGSPVRKMAAGWIDAPDDVAAAASPAPDAVASTQDGRHALLKTHIDHTKATASEMATTPAVSASCHSGEDGEFVDEADTKVNSVTRAVPCDPDDIFSGSVGDANGDAMSSTDLGMDSLFYRVMKAREREKGSEDELASRPATSPCSSLTPAFAAGRSVLPKASPSALPRAPPVNLFIPSTNRSPAVTATSAQEPNRLVLASPKSQQQKKHQLDAGATPPASSRTTQIDTISVRPPAQPVSEPALVSPLSTPYPLHTVHAPVARGRIDVLKLPRESANLPDRLVSPRCGGRRPLRGVPLLHRSSSNGPGTGVRYTSPLSLALVNGGEPDSSSSGATSSITTTSTTTVVDSLTMETNREVPLTRSTPALRGASSDNDDERTCTVGSEDAKPLEPAALALPSCDSLSVFDASPSSSSSSESGSQSDTYCQLRTRSHTREWQQQDEATGLQWVSTQIEVEELPSGVQRISSTLDAVTSTTEEAGSHASPSSYRIEDHGTSFLPPQATAGRLHPPGTLTRVTSEGTPVSCSPLEADDGSAYGGTTPLADAGRASLPAPPLSPYLLPCLAEKYRMSTQHRCRELETETRGDTGRNADGLPLAAAPDALANGSGAVCSGEASFLQSPSTHLSARPLFAHSPLGIDEGEEWPGLNTAVMETSKSANVATEALSSLSPTACAGTGPPTPQLTRPSRRVSALETGRPAPLSTSAQPALRVAPSLMDRFNVRVVDVRALSAVCVGAAAANAQTTASSVLLAPSDVAAEAPPPTTATPLTPSALTLSSLRPSSQGVSPLDDLGDEPSCSFVDGSSSSSSSSNNNSSSGRSCSFSRTCCSDSGKSGVVTPVFVRISARTACTAVGERSPLSARVEALAVGPGGAPPLAMGRKTRTSIPSAPSDDPLADDISGHSGVDSAVGVAQNLVPSAVTPACHDDEDVAGAATQDIGRPLTLCHSVDKGGGMDGSATQWLRGSSNSKSSVCAVTAISGPRCSGLESDFGVADTPLTASALTNASSGLSVSPTTMTRFNGKEERPVKCGAYSPRAFASSPSVSLSMASAAVAEREEGRGGGGARQACLDSTADALSSSVPTEREARRCTENGAAAVTNPTPVAGALPANAKGDRRPIVVTTDADAIVSSVTGVGAPAALNPLDYSVLASASIGSSPLTPSSSSTRAASASVEGEQRGGRPVAATPALTRPRFATSAPTRPTAAAIQPPPPPPTR